MARKLICSGGCGADEFSGTALVCEDWIVNEHGEFVSTLGVSQVDTPPEFYHCYNCGAMAEEVEE